MSTKELSKSTKTFIRKEKSRIRHDGTGSAAQAISVTELEQRFHKS